MTDLQLDLWPKQLQALNSSAREILYGGSAGGGKSHVVRVSAIVYALSIPGIQIYLFRRHYKDLISNHMEGVSGFRAMLAPLVEAKRCVVTETEINFPHANGLTSRISLNHCQHEKDVHNYWGSEMQVLCIEEATQFSERMIRFLRTRVRMPDTLKLPEWAVGKFPRVLYTSNPGGPGHSYFKNNFVALGAPGKVWTASEDDGGMSREYIAARLNDNPSINPTEYAKTLRGLGSPEYVRALLEGDWDAIVGAYFDVFSRDKHVTPDFTPPHHWFKFRVFDWGSYAPFAVIWLCLSDGEPFKDEYGRERWFPRGSLICYREWYGCSPMNPDHGIDLSNRDIAIGIKERTKEQGVTITLTDSLPFQDRGGKTIADEFAFDHNLPLTKGDTSRIPGWKAMKDRLLGVDGNPTLYFTQSCYHTIRTIPLLQRSISEPEDIEDGGPDHAADAIRLGCMAWTLVRDAPKQDKIVVDTSTPTFQQVLNRHIRTKRQDASSY